MIQHDKPLFSFDFDGVICRPPLGFNQVLSRSLHEEELPGKIATKDQPDSSLRRRAYVGGRTVFENFKYIGRRPMPGALEGIEAVCKVRTPIIITGRNYLAKSIVEDWLKRYKMEKYFAGVFANNTNLPIRQFKLMMLRKFNINEHADDDGSVTYYLATKGIEQVYLRDWPLNAGLPYPNNVRHFTNISEVAAHLALRV